MATFISSFFRPQAPALLAPALETWSGPLDAVTSSTTTQQQQQQSEPSGSLADCLWLAVPKRKVTPGKKRMKTTNQKKIHKKDHIIVDNRTGEITLRHRLPFNWKDYVPGNRGAGEN